MQYYPILAIIWHIYDHKYVSITYLWIPTMPTRSLDLIVLSLVVVLVIETPLFCEILYFVQF